MRFDAGQHLRMDQRMKLAPRMIQSMEILQMPHLALEERIEQELASNPTLELRDPGEDRQTVEAQQKQVDRDTKDRERELVVSDDTQRNNADDFERLSNLSEEYGESWDANTYETGEGLASRSRNRNTDGERDRKLDALANTAAPSLSLYDQLIAQWHLVETDQKTARSGEFLIAYIDADGYLRVDEQTLLDQAPPDITCEDLQAALQLLQRSLDPPGLAARNLRECLLLQIDARKRLNPKIDLESARKLVSNHLGEIEANRLPKIVEATGLSIDEIKTAVHDLRQFQPHPGRLLTDDSPRTINPDAIVEYDDELDQYIARLTSGRLPALQINRSYERMLKEKQVDKKARDFINNNVRSARWLIDAIQQRTSTLLRVIQVVLEAQREYFDQGPAALRPLPMTTVADQLGIHVATVSRAVNEKYLQTPRGIVALRMFFSGGTETDSGDAMSWTAIQAKLQQIIDEEDQSKPLSDDQLVVKLKEQGIEIARRTVAKYRKQLNIPPARQRKQY